MTLWQVFAGLVAGVAAGLLLYPLELLETRMVLERSGRGETGRPRRGGLIRMAGRVAKEEGVLALFTGCSAAVLGQGVNWMVYTSLYAQLLVLVGAVMHGGRHGARSIASDLLAGCICGCLTCWVVNPFWVVKIRLAERELERKRVTAMTNEEYVDSQAKERRQRSGAASGGVFALIADMYNEEGGVRVFYAGVFASMCGCVEGAVQFLLVEQSKRHFIHGDRATMDNMPLFMVIGSVARLAGVSLCYPYQVVRSRMQMSMATRARGDRGGDSGSIVGVVQSILLQDGVAGLYAGLSAKLAREAVYGGVLHAIYEGALSVMQ